MSDLTVNSQIFSQFLSGLTKPTSDGGAGWTPDTATAFLNQVISYINDSPTLVAQLDDLQANLWRIAYNPNQAQASTNNQNQTISINALPNGTFEDGNDLYSTLFPFVPVPGSFGNVASFVGTLAHEVVTRPL
jgi:hypothetical protein